MNDYGKVVLINPPARKKTQHWDHVDWPILGLGYLAACTEQAGLRCTIIDAKNSGLSFDEVIDITKNENPGVVGLTAMTHEIGHASEVASRVKSVLGDGCRTVIGGAHANALPKETLESFRAFDMLVFGEGEITFIEMLSRLKDGGDMEGISGLVYRDGRDIRVNMQRKYIKNLDEMPFPAWHLLYKKDGVPKIFPMMNTRGCPYNCNFCSHSLGRIVRQRSAANTVEEISYIVEKFNTELIFFCDETFTVYPRQIESLLDMIIERGLNKKVKIFCQTRAEKVNFDLLVKMKEAGVVQFGLGVESGSEEIHSNIGKQNTLTQVEKAVELAKKAGLETQANFIIGHPNETRETVMDTINFAARLNTTKVSFSTMVPYPNTKVYEMASKGEGGYKLISQDWSDFDKYLGNSLELVNLSRREMEILQIKAYLMFYWKNRRFRELWNFIMSNRRTAFLQVKKLIMVAIRRGRNEKDSKVLISSE